MAKPSKRISAAQKQANAIEEAVARALAKHSAGGPVPPVPVVDAVDAVTAKAAAAIAAVKDAARIARRAEVPADVVAELEQKAVEMEKAEKARQRG